MRAESLIISTRLQKQGSQKTPKEPSEALSFKFKLPRKCHIRDDALVGTRIGFYFSLLQGEKVNIQGVGWEEDPMKLFFSSERSCRAVSW